MPESIRILLIANRFPPQGGGGVQRPAKMVKYWARRGVPVAVLTATGETEPLHDRTLLDDVPDSVIRVAVQDPGADARLRALRSRIGNPVAKRLLQGLLFVNYHLSVPDLRSGWRRPAIKAGDELIARFRPDVIVVTGPPWTPFLVADTLARRHKLPLVLDYRDPWTQSYLAHGHGWLSNQCNARLEQRLVGRADAVISAHRYILRLLRGWMRSGARWMWVPNGSDAEDFAPGRVPGALRLAVPQRFVLGYAGAFFRRRAPRALLRVIEDLQREGRIDATRFQLRMAGSVAPALEGLAEDSPVWSLLEVQGYLPHHEAIAFLEQSTVNLVVPTSRGQRNDSTPGKFYELLHIGRPLLVISKPGSTLHLARRVGGCWMADPDDEAGTRKALLEMLSLWEQGKPLPLPNAARAVFYERRTQADRVLRFLSSLTGRPLPEAGEEQRVSGSSR